MGGGNVVQAGATLKEADLQKNGVASVEAIYDLVYNGKGKMPGYGAGCAPKVCFLLQLQQSGSSSHLDNAGGLVLLHVLANSQLACTYLIPYLDVLPTESSISSSLSLHLT